MSLQQPLPTNRIARDRSPLENARTSTYTSNLNVTTGGDSMRPPEYSLTDTHAVENYIHYRIYSEDGAIPSKTPAPGDPYLGRIKARSVPPPHTAKAVKRSIAKAENIEDRTSTSLFLTPYSQSPMGDAGKVAILNRSALGSTPQEPLALVAKISESERSALESGGRGGLANAAELDDTPTREIRYLYYQLYADDYEMASKVAVDPEKPSLGRIRADSVAPPHSPASIKRCISRAESTPGLAHADLFADISCDAPLKEGHISILRTDGPGLSPNDPMVIVQRPPITVGKFRAADIYWTAGFSLIFFIIFGRALVWVFIFIFVYIVYMVISVYGPKRD